MCKGLFRCLYIIIISSYTRAINNTAVGFCAIIAIMDLTHWPLGNFNEILDMPFTNRILVIDGSGISREIALIWISLDFTDDQSTLVQVMAWCRQATSHYLSQCWPRSLSPYGVTRHGECMGILCVFNNSSLASRKKLNGRLIIMWALKKYSRTVWLKVR